MKNGTLSLVIITLLITNIVTSYYLSTQNQNLKQAEQLISLQRTNTKIVIFTQLLIEKVLKSSGPVGFEDRLQLENTVRNLEDEEILEQWQKFVDSSDNTQAQMEIKELLDILIKKVNIIS